MTRRTATAPAGDVRSTRDLILDAAERRFAEHGFAGVSVREIAADAGLKNQASLYHHFKNKEALYESTLRRGVDAIIQMIGGSPLAAVDQTPRPGDTSYAADPFIDRVLDYLEEHPHLPRLIQRAALDGTHHRRSRALAMLRPLWQLGLASLQATSAAWTAAELPHVAAGVYHLIFGYFASIPLLEAMIDDDLGSPAAMLRQRRFVKRATAVLLGDERRTAPSRRKPT